jgi:hypothetical protein
MSHSLPPRLEFTIASCIAKRCGISIFLCAAFGLISYSRLHSDEFSSPTNSASYEQTRSWINGLNSSSYMVRRESFLKLCDERIDIQEWLSQEAKNTDPHRASVAAWLIRFRKSGGSPIEGAEILNDLAALRDQDEGVIQRYVSGGRWLQLVDLLGLLGPAGRRELVREANILESTVGSAWKMGQEAYVPGLLNLFAEPSERVWINQFWSKLGMTETWKLDERINLPSVQVTQLESEGKLDEAIELATRKGVLNLVEPILIRANRWEQWLGLDTKKVPVSNSPNVVQQRTGLLLSLGRVEEAEEMLLGKTKDRKSSKLSAGDAVFMLAVGRMEESEEFIKNLSEFEGFSVRRQNCQVKEAMQSIGLSDTSVETLARWIKDERYEKLRTPTGADDSSEPRNRFLLMIADFFDQLGLQKQCQMLEEIVIQENRQREEVEGISAWTPTLLQWVGANDRGKDRKKAVQVWIDFLTREVVRAKSIYSTAEDRDSDEASLFQTLYRDSPVAIRFLFAKLREEVVANETLSEIEVRQKLESIVEQLEDLYQGRPPKNGVSTQSYRTMIRSILTSAKLKGQSVYLLSFELAEIMDWIGETQLALETIDMLAKAKELKLAPSYTNAIRAKARYLSKLGHVNDAATLLLSEFQDNPNDLTLFLECVDQLERAGRFSDLDRVRLQAFSSTDDPPREYSSNLASTTPARPEIALIFEQNWLRTGRDDICFRLCLQLEEAANQQPFLARKAAKYARISLLDRLKYFWSADRFGYSPLRYWFSRYLLACILEAVVDQDEAVAESLMQMAHRINPTEIELPIAVIRLADKTFSKELVDRWFYLFYTPMMEHVKTYPEDHLYGNNTAWLAASCNREIEAAYSMAMHVTASDPSPTYLDTLAEIEYRMGNVQRAIELSERCRALEPKSKHHPVQLRRFREGKP